MADDTAHDPAGPESDPTDPNAADTASAAPGPVEAAAPHTERPGSTGRSGPIGTGVELVGRSTAPVAQLADGEPVPVLVGTAAATRVDDGSSIAVTRPRSADAPTHGGPLADGSDDLPTWSFHETAGRGQALAPQRDRDQAELPFAPATLVVTQHRRSQPMFGPVGVSRSTVAVPLLAVVSLGVYALLWHGRVNRELEEFDPQLHSRPGRSTLAVTVPWLIGLLVSVAGAVLVVADRFAIHLPFDAHLTTTQAYYLLAGLAAVPYLALLLPFSVVAIVMTLERLRSVEEHVGTTTDRQVRPVRACLLLAVPVIGGLVLLAVQQRRLNDIWDAVAPTERAAS